MINSTNINIKNLDHLGIVAGLIDKIELVDVINNIVGIAPDEKITTGEVVKAMLLNGLGFFTSPLYLFTEFFSGKAIKHLMGKSIEAEWLNDDKLGRTLDKLYQSSLSRIFLEISRQAAQIYQLEQKTIHLDSTSISLSGEYKRISLEESGEYQPIAITHGYSKDHRPDLKQFLINLITTSDGDVPLFIKIGSGNESDKKTFAQIIKDYKNQIDWSTIVVADSALYSSNNIKELSGIKWITRVPSTIREAKCLLQKEEESRQLFPIIPEYKGQEIFSNYGGIEQRWLLVSSRQRKKADLDKLEEKILKEHQKTRQKLIKLNRENYESQSQANRQIKEIEKEFKYHKITVEFQPVTTGGWLVNAKIVRNENSIQKARNQAGIFILATNELDETKISTESILTEYKKQQGIERGFAFLKDPLFFADSLYLKNPERIAAMGMLMALCLMVYKLGERALRMALADSEAILANQLGKPTKTPTLRWIFQQFQGLHVVESQGQVQLTNLTNSRREILRFLPKPCQEYYLLV